MDLFGARDDGGGRLDREWSCHVHFPHRKSVVAVLRTAALPPSPELIEIMAAMTISAPMALAGARPAQALRRRSAMATSVKSAAPVTARRGALQVRAAIAMPGPETPLVYSETGKWRENFDLAAWGAEIRELEKELKQDIDQDDVNHLNKILTWANLFYFGGLAVMFATPFFTSAFNVIGGVNPIAAFMMSTAICARWTMVGHHVCHGGYNSVQSESGVVTGRFHRRTFAKGIARRITDWMDWMMPEAWDVEHNHLHHYQVRTVVDPEDRPPAQSRAARRGFESCYFFAATSAGFPRVPPDPRLSHGSPSLPSHSLSPPFHSSASPRIPISWSAT